MKPLAFSFAGRMFTVGAPAVIAAEIAAFFALCARGADLADAAGDILVTETTPGRFALTVDGAPLSDDLTRGQVVARLASEIGCGGAVPALGARLRAAAVGWNDKAILIVGPEHSGKSALAAWLVDKGFAYRADGCALVEPATARITGFPGPLALDPARLSHVATLEAFRQAPSMRAGDRMLICPHPTWLAADASAECGLVIDVRYGAGASPGLEPLTAEQTAAELNDGLTAPANAATQTAIACIAAQAPALRLTYGGFAQIDGLLDFLAPVIVETETTPGELDKFLRSLPGRNLTPKVYPIPARSERKLQPKLTIGMATYDDFDGAYFSIQAIRMYHPEVLNDVELVLIDNHPDGLTAEPLKTLEQAFENYRYIPMAENRGTALSRERLFIEAAGEYVLCIDSHVFIAPGAIRKLLDYYAANPVSTDLLHGPMLNDALTKVSTHYSMRWRRGFCGVWEGSAAGDDPDAPPFEITAAGLGLFACRRDAWPGFNPAFRGFGGEEGYIHEKFRRQGGRVLCLPFLRWLHRYQRPQGVPYPNSWQDRIRNYTLALSELGLPLDEMHAHYREVLGEHADPIFDEIAAELDKRR